MAEEEQNLPQLVRKCVEDLKKVKTDTNQEKKLRDEANSQVKKAKEDRDVFTKELSKYQKELNELLKANRDFANLDKRKFYNLKDEFDKLNWEYQTGSVSVKKEKELVKELDSLESQLVGFNKYKKAEKQIRKLKKQVAILRKKVLEHHANVIKFADESEKHHQEMKKLNEKLKKLLEEKKKYDSDFSDIRKEDDKARKETQQYQDNKMHDLKIKLMEQGKAILTKFKAGEKITADEMKVLQETDLM